MRQNSTLGIIIALLVALALGVGAYLYLNNSSTTSNVDVTSLQPTIIPPPDVLVLEAASDIPSQRLISAADFETLFSEVPVRPSEVGTGDVLASEFSGLVQGQVTNSQIRGGERIKRNLFRPAGVAELIPTAAPGQSARKAMSIFVTDLGNIAAQGNTVDILASFTLEQPYLRVSGVTQEEGRTIIQLTDSAYLDISTHVIAQNIPVLSVTPPPIIQPEGAAAPPPPTVVAEGTEAGGTAAEPAPTAEIVFNQGSQWTVVLAVTDQEAELIDYTRNKNNGLGLSLIVRRADDAEQVTTTGVTMDLLMRLYGVAQVYAQPNMLVDLLKSPPPPLPGNQNPVVIPIQLPFGPGVAVPLPTAAPTAAP